MSARPLARSLAVAVAILASAAALAEPPAPPVVEVAREQTAWHLAAAGALAILLRQIMEALQKIGTDEKLQKVGPVARLKRWSLLICAALGVAVAVLTHYAMGSTWLDAAIVGIGGPSAVLINEAVNMLRPAPAEGLELPPDPPTLKRVA